MSGKNLSLCCSDTSEFMIHESLLIFFASVIPLLLVSSCPVLFFTLLP